ncbi:hypothetical protein BJY01DRAFT_15287 [Aspergillus pseudoustus]|uniref:DUF6594 domain-containing protein n=1 Tax=Aspergillus pseudoustus TaxID=1810923 RepID=A0ABR4JMJ0_9EURO
MPLELASALVHMGWTENLKDTERYSRQIVATDQFLKLFPSATPFQTKMPRTIEDYRPGYPRFTALISAHEPFFMCRRFIKLRARILLLKQDRLSMLEQKLEQVDHEEASPLFLAKSRWDKNSERASLLSEIEASLSDYDQFTERTFQMLNIGRTCERDVESLQHWLDGTGSLAREEREYLTHRDDLASLAPTRDSAMAQIETWIEDKLVILLPSQHKVREPNGQAESN